MASLRSASACVLSALLAAVLVVAASSADRASAGAPDAYDPACAPAAAPDPTTDPTRILLTGDSMSNGFSGDFTWRYFFDQHLRDSHVNFDFVGPWSDLLNRYDQTWGNHEYAVCGFDQDHYARGGGKLSAQVALLIAHNAITAPMPTIGNSQNLSRRCQVLFIIREI